ncbi:hypothetical protein J4440_00560 [Candidatus Woesearchaeota archaeon]|nr:hypothetical protein [Candidatus Woesearchaeota archaeon]
MIKKNTKIIFDGENNKLEALEGGMSLSKNEIINIHEGKRLQNMLSKIK